MTPCGPIEPHSSCGFVSPCRAERVPLSGNNEIKQSKSIRRKSASILDAGKRSSRAEGFHACYDRRENPIRFQQFSHPSDDYHKMEMVAQDDNDSQPECPCGTACYRKNPQHKLEYKHSAPPGKRAVKKDSVNDGEASEYDLNDRFLDEEEEECKPTDEDSDWEPSSEEKDNEDVDTIVQETCGFVRIKI